MGLIGQSKKLADVLVKETLGEEFLKIIKPLKRKKEMSELELAEKFDKDVNYTRSLLYQLHSKGYVGFFRRKDPKIGWYTYYWYLKHENILSSFFKYNEEKIKALQRRLEREKQTLYFECPNKCMRLDFHTSSKYNFKCLECGTLMEPLENKKQVKEIKNAIASLKATLKLKK